MKDADCVALLQWCLARLGYRWPGFRKVRRQVCKRIGRRLNELGLADAEAYKKYLETHENEWSQLDAFCQITISRFYRDRAVFDALRDQLLPMLTERAIESGRPSVDCWSIGCCSGEEPYTLQIIWQLAISAKSGTQLPLRILATDLNERVLERARMATYAPSSLSDLPENVGAEAFDAENGVHVLKPAFRKNVVFEKQDIRAETPRGPFDLVLCRNLAFTYFEESVQFNVLKKIHTATRADGFLVLGSHERLPSTLADLYSGFGPSVLRRADGEARDYQA